MKPKALILLFIIVIAIAAAVFSMKPVQSPKTAQVGSATHDFELIDSSRNRISLSSMKGSVVFINFWATWCASCIEEMPAIERMYRNLSENSSFKVVSILYKDDLNQALNFMKENGFTFPVYLNTDESAAKILGITGIPETFIIDKRGMLRNKVIGPAEWDSPRVREMIQALINES
jgi:cytochrome c biogenesis protein CcmG, thiol:disulfide interchange protein DsbE